MIRRLRATDLELYRAIRSEALRTVPDAFGETLDVFESRSEQELRTWFVGTVEDPDRLILVEEAEGEPRGMCGVGSVEDDPATGFLWGMFVSARARGRGVGRMLLSEGVAWLTGRGARRLRADVAAPNDDAIRFYRAAGFSVRENTGVLRPGSDVPVHRVELALDPDGARGKPGSR